MPRSAWMMASAPGVRRVPAASCVTAMPPALGLDCCDALHIRAADQGAQRPDVHAGHSSRRSRRQSPVGRTGNRLAQSGQMYPERPEPAVAANITAQGDMKFQNHSRDPVGRAVQTMRRGWDDEPVPVERTTFCQPVQAADKGVQIARVACREAEI